MAIMGLSTRASVLLMVGLLLAYSNTNAQPREMKQTEIRGHTMYTLLSPGDIPAIFEPKFISIADAETSYKPLEPLIVVVDGSEARGYSTWHLDHHEVVNDRINKRAITVTW